MQNLFTEGSKVQYMGLALLLVHLPLAWTSPAQQECSVSTSVFFTVQTFHAGRLLRCARARPFCKLV